MVGFLYLRSSNGGSFCCKGWWWPCSPWLLHFWWLIFGVLFQEVGLFWIHKASRKDHLKSRGILIGCSCCHLFKGYAAIRFWATLTLNKLGLPFMRKISHIPQRTIITSVLPHREAVQDTRGIRVVSPAPDCFAQDHQSQVPGCLPWKVYMCFPFHAHLVKIAPGRVAFCCSFSHVLGSDWELQPCYGEVVLMLPECPLVSPEVRLTLTVAIGLSSCASYT